MPEYGSKSSSVPYREPGHPIPPFTGFLIRLSMVVPLGGTTYWHWQFQHPQTLKGRGKLVGWLVTTLES
eukprot:5623828-Pyramimonas_sp.AAC.2